MAEEDFDEEEVWAVPVVKERRDGSPRGIAARDPGPPSASSAPRRLPTGSSRMIPRSNAEGRQSAPVNIPEWSRIQKQQKGSAGDEEGEDDEVVPPHEWITKKLARSQISSSSVCEGAGRTLKGRDLSKVRNAVLTRTGFLE